MGGTQGLGPIKELVWLIERSAADLQVIIAAGTNKKLHRWLSRRVRRFPKKTLVYPFAANVDELMEAASVIITKPGGITTAEALAKGLPMLIVNPLPGQETMNTRFLLKEGVAVKAESPRDAVIILDELLYSRHKLTQMAEKARLLAKPDSAIATARLVLDLAR
jgi:processive 1,2-diacylglycerol beta-glucosyltransferase